MINESAAPSATAGRSRAWSRSLRPRAGVILNLGEGGRSLWFAGSGGSGGGTYTDPPAIFRLWSRTRAAAIPARSQTAPRSPSIPAAMRRRRSTSMACIPPTVQRINQLTTITDPYSNITTFTYSGSYLQTIKDPAGRLTTFTFSGGNLTAGHAAGRHAPGITPTTRRAAHPDQGPALERRYRQLRQRRTRRNDHLRRTAPTEEFSTDQEQGWTNSGTSVQPGAGDPAGRRRRAPTPTPTAT